MGAFVNSAIEYVVSEMGKKHSPEDSSWEETVFEATQGLFSYSLVTLKFSAHSPKEMGRLQVIEAEKFHRTERALGRTLCPPGLPGRKPSVLFLSGQASECALCCGQWLDFLHPCSGQRWWGEGMKPRTSGELTLRGGGGHHRGFQIYKSIFAVGTMRGICLWNRPLESSKEGTAQASRVVVLIIQLVTVLLSSKFNKLDCDL